MGVGGAAHAVVEAVSAGHGPAGGDVRGGCTTKYHLPPGRRGTPGSSVCTVSRVDLVLVAAGAWASRFGFRRLHLKSDASGSGTRRRWDESGDLRSGGMSTLPAVGVLQRVCSDQRVPLSRSSCSLCVHSDLTRSKIRSISQKNHAQDQDRTYKLEPAVLYLYSHFSRPGLT